MDTVQAIEDQLHTLQAICSAQRVSTGITCGAPAVAVAEIHAIDGCDQMGLSLDPWMNWLAIGCRNEESAL